MQTKTTPAGTGVIFNDVSIRSIRSRHNHTTGNSLGKHFKTPPFADQICNRSKLWHVRVGLDAFELAAKDYKNADPRYPISVFALPWGENPFHFIWPVCGKSVDILSAGKHSHVVQQLGNALHACGAAHVYGRVGGDIVHWCNTIRKAA